MNPQGSIAPLPYSLTSRQHPHTATPRHPPPHTTTHTRVGLVCSPGFDGSVGLVCSPVEARVGLVYTLVEADRNNSVGVGGVSIKFKKSMVSATIISAT